MLLISDLMSQSIKRDRQILQFIKTVKYLCNLKPQDPGGHRFSSLSRYTKVNTIVLNRF